ncbi:MAG TPA: hypothetical protein VN950_04505 [Terriglobales bacterium]|nr:hypothetical protein [Terriglobales bacterium]
MLAFEEVSASDITLLLDWLDEVRVGLWLGFLYLTKNPWKITPKFQIESRMGVFDRMVAILRLAEPEDGLSFFGPMSNFYAVSPTCFGLRVNEFCFVNASGLDLCSRRLGFPFATPIRLEKDGKLQVTFNPGSGRIMSPVERREPLPDTTYHYQPIFRGLIDSDDADVKARLDADWMRCNTVDSAQGLGKLFTQNGRTVAMYPDMASKEWIPQNTWDVGTFIIQIPQYIAMRLAENFENSIRIAPRSEQKDMCRHAMLSRRLDRAMLVQYKSV